MFGLFCKKKKIQVGCPVLFLHKTALKPCHNLFVLSQQRIIPLTEELFESYFKVKHLDHLFFEEESSFYILKEKTDKHLERTLIRQMRLWAKAMFFKEYNLQAHPKLLIKKIDPIMGLGVVAHQDIATYSYIGEYTGIVRKRSKRKDELNDYVFGFPLCNKDSSFVIDAKDYGNHTRFINHSDEPNLLSRWMEKDGVCHVILYANRLIHQGEQLTYHYGPLYWRKRPAPIEFLS